MNKYGFLRKRSSIDNGITLPEEQIIKESDFIVQYRCYACGVASEFYISKKDRFISCPNCASRLSRSKLRLK